MKRILLLLLSWLVLAAAYAQDIDRIEYFIDNDPGYGSGTEIPPTGGPWTSMVTNHSFTVPVAVELATGLHRLFIRARDENGGWSMVSSHLFYKDEFVYGSTLPDITRIEYFIDNDPGYGSATELTGHGGGTDVNGFSFQVPIASELTDGLHRLFIRAQNAAGNWSVVSNHLFYKDSFVSGGTLPDITRIEYFIDNDPGYGSATELTGHGGGTDVNGFSFQVPVASELTDGLHRLFIRARNAVGNWSVVSNHLFYKDSFVSATLPDIVKVEYFVDSDPGYGAATDVPVTPGAEVYDLAFAVNAASLSAGMHKLFIRAQNALGHWSVVGIKDFSVQDNGVALLDFPQAWCVDNAITIPFQATGPFGASNEYKVQLSYNGGSFPGDITSQIIGTLASNAQSGTISLSIPNGMGIGAGEYKVRMIATDPQVPGGSNIFSEEIPVTITATCPCPAVDLVVTGNITAEILCFDDETGAVLLSGSGGKGPLKYSIGGGFQGNPAFTGLAAGSYTVTVRDVNFCIANAAAPLVIEQPEQLVFAAPTLTSVTCHAGTDGKIAVSVSGGTGAYTYSIDGTNFQLSAEFTGLTAGDYTITVKDANECLMASTTYTVTQPPALSSALSGGGGPAVCEGTPRDIAVTVTNGTAPFTVVYSDGSSQFTVNGYTSGNAISVAPLVTTTYTLVSVTDANGCTSPTLTGSAVITVVPKPTTANAGPDQTGAATCGLTTVTLAANAPTVGTGQWSIVSGMGGSFADAASPTSAFTGAAGATYVLKWTISNAPCTASEDEVTIIFNQLPTTASAGPDQTSATTCGLTTVTLAANTPAIGTGAWTVVSGMGGSFADAASPTSAFTGAAGATYVLKWTISNAPCTASSDEVTITFNQLPTTASAGPNQTGAATCGLTTVTLAANAPTVGTGQWSVVSGAGGSFADAADPTSAFTGTAGATYVLKWTISNAPCTASEDEVTVTFNQLPTAANAGPDQTGATTCGLTTVPLAANAPTVGMGQWSIVSGAGGSFANTASPTSTFTGTAGVTYVLKWTISNAPCTASEDDVTITFGNALTLAIDDDNTTAIIPDNTDYNLLATDCRIIATVNGAGLTNGTIPFAASVVIDDEVGVINTQPVLQRHFALSPGGTNPTAATITLYVTKAEMEAFNDESTEPLPEDPSDDKSKLRVWQWNGSNTPSGIPDAVIDPLDSDITWDATLQAWKIKFAVTGFSSFFITAEGATPLPVTLLNFTAQKLENSVQLLWKTTEEANSDHFEVYHSPDGQKWNAIGPVAAAGESRSVRSYSYAHQSPVNGLNYYRLKTVDRDGSYAWSKIVSAHFSFGVKTTLFPNPASRKAVLSGNQSVVSYKLMSATGHALRTVSLPASVLETEIPLDGLPAGIYLVVAMLENGQVSHHRVVVE